MLFTSNLQGTLMAALISGLALWATMILAAREMLSESVMNFPLVLVMGAILIAVFVIISSNFKSLLNEFGSAFYFSEVVLFGIIPLMSSVIISWFLCVEIPTLNLPFCFSTCYFLYTMWLGAPRESSHPLSRSSNTPGNTMLYVLPKNVLQAVYFIPLVVSPALHIALCHHVILDSWGRIVGVAISFLYPFLCMLTCAENQMKYWPAERRPKILNDINNRKLGASALFFFFMQNHPILDDLKKLSGEPKAVSSAILCGAALAGSLTLYLHRLVKSHRTNALRNMTLDDVNNGNDVMRSAKLIFVSFLFSSGTFGLLVFYFLGVSWIPLGFFMGFFIATFYGVPENFRWQHLGNTAVTNFVLLILVILMRFLLLDFLYKTVVIYMTFKFDWSPSPMTMTSYCGRICDVFTLAVAAPTFALGLNDHHSDEQTAKQASLLPIGTPASKVDSPVVEALNTLKGFLFAAHLLLFSVTFTIAELILREQVRIILSNSYLFLIIIIYYCLFLFDDLSVLLMLFYGVCYFSCHMLFLFYTVS